MSSVPWDKFSPKLYEDMVAVLLSHLNPAVRRVDGRGGDEGRDVYFKTPSRHDIFELKSFTGRMTKARRRQVVKSLRHAKGLKPDSWSLVVPMDPTPDEEKWFDGLRKEFPFPIDWKGQTWLDAQIAPRPFIPRYFIEATADEVISLLKELNQEDAGLARGVPDALARVSRLATRLNELDPYYTFTIASDGTRHSVAVKERYAGAAEERPIKVDFTLNFPDDDAGREALRQVRRFVEFGEPVDVGEPFVEHFKVEGPAGLSHESSGGTSLRLGPSEVEEPWKVDVLLVVLNPGGMTIAELPLSFTRRTRGTRGAILHGQDRTGALRMRMEVDLATGKVNIHVSYATPEGALPEDVLPILDIIHDLTAPNLFVMREASTGSPFGQPTPCGDTLIKDEGHVAVIRALAQIQRETRQRFPIPTVFEQPDLEAMDRALHLLDGKVAGATWTDMSFETTPRKLLAFRDMIEQGTFPVEYVGDGAETVKIAGRVIALGRARFKYESARLKNPDEVLQAATAATNPDDPMSVKLVPGDSDRVEIRLER